MNSEYSLFKTSCHTKAEEPSLSYYLTIAGGRIIGFIPFPMVLVLCEMQSVSSRIWTRVTVSISYDDNHYTTDYREAKKLCWCPSWSNSLWQRWSCGLVYCPGRNATDPIWRVLASSDEISCWTPLKPQHSNPNPNPLANQLWSIDLPTPRTPLVIPHRLSAFLESLMPLKNWYSIHARFSKSSLKHSKRFCSIIFSKFKTEFYCISFF